MFTSYLQAWGLLWLWLQACDRCFKLHHRVHWKLGRSSLWPVTWDRAENLVLIHVYAITLSFLTSKIWFPSWKYQEDLLSPEMPRMWLSRESRAWDLNGCRSAGRVWKSADAGIPNLWHWLFSTCPWLLTTQSTGFHMYKIGDWNHWLFKHRADKNTATIYECVDIWKPHIYRNTILVQR